MFTEVYVTPLPAAVLAIEVLMPMLYALDLRYGAVLNVLAGTAFDVVLDVGIDNVRTDMNATMWAAATTPLDCTAVLASSAETLLFCVEACSC